MTYGKMHPVETPYTLHEITPLTHFLFVFILVFVCFIFIVVVFVLFSRRPFINNIEYRQFILIVTGGSPILKVLLRAGVGHDVIKILNFSAIQCKFNR